MWITLEICWKSYKLGYSKFFWAYSIAISKILCNFVCRRVTPIWKWPNNYNKNIRREPEELWELHRSRYGHWSAFRCYIGVFCLSMTQEQQVIDTLRSQGGYATLRRLNEVMDFSSWKTKTPEASVRRIVQNSDAIFRIQPGLWALEESRDKVLRKFNIKEGDSRSIEQFNHAYYQGLLIEIGHYRNSSTYVPPQDQHRLFLDKELGDLTTINLFHNLHSRHYCVRPELLMWYGSTREVCPPISMR